MDLSIFHVFRRVLVIVVMTYTTAQMINFIWRWRADSIADPKPHRIMRRYVEVVLLRFRLKPWWFDLAQITVLVAILWIIVSFQI